MENKNKGNGQRVVLSDKLRRVGRPRSRFTPAKVVQTRVPDAMYRYCKTLQPLRYDTLTQMFADMLRKFREERPWEHGLMWRKPKTPLQSDGRTGWKQVNIHVEEVEKEEVKSLCKELNVSTAAFCYTMIYWWIEYVHPYKQT